MVQRNTHEGGGGDGVFEDVVLCGEMAGDDARRLSASASLCSLHSSSGVQCNKTSKKKHLLVEGGHAPDRAGAA